MWKTLGLYTRKPLECYKQSLMDSSMCTHKNIASKGCVHQVSRGNKDSVRNWIRDHSYYAVPKYKAI